MAFLLVKSIFICEAQWNIVNNHAYHLVESKYKGENLRIQSHFETKYAMTGISLVLVYYNNGHTIFGQNFIENSVSISGNHHFIVCSNKSKCVIVILLDDVLGR